MRRFDRMSNAEETDPPFLPFIRMLERRDRLSSDEIDLINSLPVRRLIVPSGADIVAEDSRPRESCIIIRGFAARSHYLQDGGRELTALHVPGDFVDLHAYLLKIIDHGVVAMGTTEVGFVPHEAIRRVTEAGQHLGRLFWLSTVIDAAIQRAWITCLGRRSAERQIAHLVCELYLRLQAADQASDNRFDFPLTQAQLADLLGLSIVHVNRKLQELRQARLLEWKGRVVTIPSLETLAAFADFDPTYLNLHVEPR